MIISQINKKHTMAFNLHIKDFPNKPFINLHGLKNEQGGVLEVLKNYRTTMNAINLKEEARYFTANDFDLSTVKMLGLSYDNIINFIHLLCDSDLLHTESITDDDGDEYITVKVHKTKKINPNTEKNYLGRTPIYYATTKTMHSIIQQDIGELFQKDNLNFDVLDHYLLSHKINEAKVFLDYLIINFDKDEHSLITNNHNVLNINFKEKLIKQNIDLWFTYTLIKSNLSKEEGNSLGEDFISLINKKTGGKSNSDVKKDESILGLLSMITKNNYLKNEDNREFINAVYNKLFSDIVSNDTKAKVEQLVINNEISDVTHSLPRKMKL